MPFFGSKLFFSSYLVSHFLLIQNLDRSDALHLYLPSKLSTFHREVRFIRLFRGSNFFHHPTMVGDNFKTPHFKHCVVGLGININLSNFMDWEKEIKMSKSFLQIRKKMEPVKAFFLFKIKQSKSGISVFLMHQNTAEFLLLSIKQRV